MEFSFHNSYVKDFAKYSNFLDITQLLAQKLRFSLVEVIATKIYRPHHELNERYDISISQMSNGTFPFFLKFFLSIFTDKTITKLDL